MSAKLTAALRAREAAKRPQPVPAPVVEPKKARRPKVAPQGEYEAELAKPNHVPGEYVEGVETVSTGEDPGFTVTVERDSADERVFEVPS